MSNKPKTQKKYIQDGYSHPLIKEIETQIEEDHQSIIPTYQPFKPNHQHRISIKIARYAFSGPPNQKEVGLFINPFNQIVEDLPQLQQVHECKYCKSKPSPLTSFENHSLQHCYICKQKTEVSANSHNYSSSLFGYKILPNQYNKQKDFCQNTKSMSQKTKNKKVCFVIQKSQQNYESGVHKSIMSTLRALQGQSLLVSFVLFDNKSLILVNEYLQVSKISFLENQSFDMWQTSPFFENEIFMQINNNLDRLEQVINSLMYQAFYLNQSLIVETVDMISKCFPPPIQVNFFITTLNHLYDPHQNDKKKNNFFKQKQNKIKEVIQKKFKLINTNDSIQLQKPKILSNTHFYIIPYKTSFRQSLQLLKFSVAKIYDLKQQTSIQNQLYYDLYESLTQQIYYNTQFIIRTPHALKLNFLANYSDSLYSNLQLREIQQNKSQKINVYKIVVRQSTKSFLLPLKFKINNTSSFSNLNQLVQLEYSIGNFTQKVILNILLKQTIQNKNKIESVDDEALFNFHLRQCLATWDGENFRELKQFLDTEYTESVREIMNEGSNSISFPKNWKHYLLYSFMLEELLSQGALNCYHIYCLLNKTLQSFSKNMYFRAYKLEDKPKNIKCGANIFQKYQLVLLQDGERLYFVFNDPSVQQIKEIFGYYDTIPSLAINHLELPIIHSNLKYRQAITSIRANNQHNFLPLSIIDYQSSSFTEKIEPRLYHKQKHMEFLRKLWKNA